MTGRIGKGETSPSWLDIIQHIIRARLYIIGGVLIGACMAGLFLGAAIPHEKAHMIISPASPMSGSETSSLLANDNLFALRYLAQNIGARGTNDFTSFEHIFDGVRVAEQLLDDPLIKSGLAHDRRLSFLDPDPVDTPEELATYIQKHVRLEPVGTSSLRRMVYTHPRGDFAAYFIERIHDVTDTLIRQNVKTEAATRAAYLKQTIGTTVNPAHRQTLTTLLLEQERLLMLVSIDSPYAATVVEPASVAIKPAWPNTPLVVLSALLGGGLVGFMVFGLVQALPSEQNTVASSPQKRPQKWDDILRASGENENSPGDQDENSNRRRA